MINNHQSDHEHMHLIHLAKAFQQKQPHIFAQIDTTGYCPVVIHKFAAIQHKPIKRSRVSQIHSCVQRNFLHNGQLRTILTGAKYGSVLSVEAELILTNTSLRH